MLTDIKVLDLPRPIPTPDPEWKEKINLNFYFRTSLWLLKRFHEGLKGLDKIFAGTAKKFENKNSS